MTILSSRQQYWLEKIFAFLHDPPYKSYVLFTLPIAHEEYAKRLMKSFQLPLDKIDEHVEKRIYQSDWLSSAMSRLVIRDFKQPYDAPRSPEHEQFSHIQKTKVIEMIDPWAEEPSKTKERALVRSIDYWRVTCELRKFLRHVPKEKQFEILFHLLFRVFPSLYTTNEYTVMFDYPADTRVPNHSLFDHVVETSAIYSTLPQPALLLVSISPVQNFIAQARKALDFYSGSYLLSYLIWKGIRLIAKKYGPDHIIYPSLTFQGLYEHTLLIKLAKSSHKLFRFLIKNKYPWYRIVQIANLPNRFLALVPLHSKTDIPTKIQQAIEEEWRSLVLTALMIAFDYVKNGGLTSEKSFPERIYSFLNQTHTKDLESFTDSTGKLLAKNEQKWLKDLYDNQAKSYFTVHSTLLPFTLQSKGGAYEVETCFSKETLNFIRKEYINYFTSSEAQDVLDIFETLLENPRYHQLPVTMAYPLLSALFERWHRADRDKASYPTPRGYQKGRQCSICGEHTEIGTIWATIVKSRESEFSQVSKISNEFWSNFRMTRGLPILVRENEYLCAICWTKRLFPHILRVFLRHSYLRQYRKISTPHDFKKAKERFPKFFDIARFPSVREIAGTRFKMKLLEYFFENTNSMDDIKGLQEYITYLKDLHILRKPSSILSWHVTFLRHWLKMKLKGKKLPASIHQTFQYFLKIDSTLFEFTPPSYEEFQEFLGGNKNNLLKDYTNFKNKHSSFISNWTVLTGLSQKDYPKRSSYYALVYMDGDKMGDFISGLQNPKIKDVIHSKIRENLENQGHDLIMDFLEKQHPMTPAWHRMLSRRLAEFSTRHLINLFFEKYPAQLVYAGGDDVVFFAPVEVVLPLAYEIRKLFKEKVLPDGDMSAGIVIVHEKFPLHLAIEEARNAEKRAKSKRGRSAFELCVIKRSGDRETCGFKWDAGVINGMNIFEKLIRVFVEKNENIPLSSRFPYKLAELYQDAGLLSEHASEKELSDIKELATSLLRFAFSRSLEKKGDESQCHELLEQLVTLLNAEQVTPANFAQGLLNINFIARQSVKPIFKPQNGGS